MIHRRMAPQSAAFPTARCALARGAGVASIEGVPEPSALPRSAPDRVALTTLSLQDLRSYIAFQAAFDARLVVLTGENGVGKTNLLESISLLAPGRGLRRAAFDEITRHGAGGGWAVAATIVRGGEETRIGTGLVDSVPGEGRTRRVRLNGATASSADRLLDYLRVLWLTPAMDGLFLGPAAERRRFLDRLVLTMDAAHGRRTRDFDRLLTQRNRLLEEGASPSWIDAVEGQLAGHAVALSLARAETAALLTARMATAATPSFPVGAVALPGEFDRAIVGRKAAESETWYAQALAASRSADRAAGRTLLGPHRSDVDVVFVEKFMPAALSSTGEQKALLLGLVLAHADLVAEIAGMTPVLLLDEIAAHLDRGRRVALFERLAALGAQVFMTGTDAALFDDIPAGAARYSVAGGRLDRID
jgi:DNA replication and repair protein RecF